MIVVDASAIVEVIAFRPAVELLRRLSAEPVLHAPHLLDIEVLSSLRSASLRGAITDTEAAAGRSQFESLAIDRYPHRPLADAIWSLRHNLSTYDATYVALAAALDATLVTTDERIALAPGVEVDVAVYQSSGR